MRREATVGSRDDVKNGKGPLSTESTALKETRYSFTTRFEDGVGTYAKEMRAAEHGGGLAMTALAQLSRAGLTHQDLAATATVTFERVGEYCAITKNHLDLLAEVARAHQATFNIAAKADESGRRIARPFKVRISVDARLKLTA